MVGLVLVVLLILGGDGYYVVVVVFGLVQCLVGVVQGVLLVVVGEFCEFYVGVDVQVFCVVIGYSVECCQQMLGDGVGCVWVGFCQKYYEFVVVLVVGDVIVVYGVFDVLCYCMQ